MTFRLVCAAIVAAATLVATTGVSNAQPINDNDPEGRFSGGAPRGKMYTAFGGYHPIRRSRRPR